MCLHTVLILKKERKFGLLGNSEAIRDHPSGMLMRARLEQSFVKLKGFSGFRY